MLALLRPAPSFLAALAGSLLLAASSAAQQLPQPQASPAATLTQAIGVTDVTLRYHRPAVKGRTVWGELVPYGEVWRAGANENTTIAFSTPVKVDGHDLAAGVYGLHMIPTTSTWTVIFSRNSTSWGSYAYDEKEDALRVTVTPVKAAATESLTFEFSDLTTDGATLSLRWENLAVPLHLTVNTQELVLAGMRSALGDLSGTDWRTFNSAAAYCLTNNVNLEEALTWSEASLALKQTYRNMNVNAGLLEALGRKDEAGPIRQEALALATEEELTAAGFQYLEAKQLEQALEVFKANVAAHPDSVPAHDGLAQASALKGDKKAAIDHYRKALQLATDAETKSRLEGELKKLGAG